MKSRCSDENQNVTIPEKPPVTNSALASCLPSQKTRVQLQICCLRKISSKPRARAPRSRRGEI